MIEPLDEFYQRMTYRLNQLREERSELEEILAFYDKVLAAQQQTQRETAIPDIDLPEERLRLKVEEGFPLIDRGDFQVDRDSFRELLRRICHLSMEENPVLAAAGKTLLEAMDSGTLDLVKLTTAVLQNDTEAIEAVAKDLDVTTPVVQALTKLSLQPSLLASVQAVAQRAAIDEWHYGYCPVCGGPPAMAALVGEEGKREAICSFCGHFWQLPRLMCPFCSTEKQEDLRYFHGEGDDLYRVYVCEQCRGYLKVMDTREGGDARTLAVDDVASGHLDLLAEEEGYQRKAPRLWGI
jgi:FdhE protein